MKTSIWVILPQIIKYSVIFYYFSPFLLQTFFLDIMVCYMWYCTLYSALILRALWQAPLEKLMLTNTNTQMYKSCLKPKLNFYTLCFLLWCSAGVSNEARFVFSVQSIVMPQKLKGTLTFIVKVKLSSQHTVHIHTMTTPIIQPDHPSVFSLIVGRFLNSWETGLQTALYLHIIPNNNSMLQVRSERFWVKLSLVFC